MKLYSINEWKDSMINEAFKSTALSNLNDVFKNTDNRYSTNTKKIWNAFAKAFKIRVSELTDDQAYTTTGKDGLAYSKKHKDAIVFFVNGNILLAAMQGGKHTRISGSEYKYYLPNTYKVSKKQKDGWAYQDGSSTKGVKTGISAERGISVTNKDLQSETTIAYVIEAPTDAEKEITTNLRKTRKELFGFNLNNGAESILQANKDRYKEIIRQRDELRRADMPMDPEAMDMIFKITKSYELFVMDTIKNPTKYTSGAENRVTYGHGGNRHTYITSALKLYAETHKYFDQSVEIFKQGKDLHTTHEYRQFLDKYTTLTEVLSKVGF